MTSVVRVALPTPLYHGFDYLPPTGGPAPAAGTRVRVPFGRRRLVGVVTDPAATPGVATNRLKRIATVLDAKPVLPAHIRQLAEWAARYYQHPPGEVFAAVLPTLLRRGRPAERDKPRVWQLTEDGRALDTARLKRAPRQLQVIERLQDGPVAEAELRAALRDAASVLKRVSEHGWVSCTDAPTPARTTPAQAPALHAEQAEAVAGVDLDAGFAATLLHGVTGSGKTEVYLHLIEQALAAGRQALVLVPEIGLTPQLVARFTERLGAPPTLLHSGLTPAQRLDGWLAARDGEARVIIGTRSAVFTPLARPGLIVVDEEHDPSYKQQDGLRYSARDVAVRRAQMHGVPIVLGTATPALESLQNALDGRYRHVRLDTRAGGAAPPRIRLLDVRSRPLAEGLSEPLIQRLRQHVDDGGQAMLFLNRRGYAPALLCHDCGWTAPCRRCDVGMTVHRGGRGLRCHHCGAARPADVVCGQCGGEELIAVGEGTERVTAALRARLPGVPVARFDRDTTARKGSLERLLAQVRTGDARVLVGTQMLAKGHDFPDLSFVGVVNADHGLFSHDFRAFERMAQLVTQVAGRAGRGVREGEVVLQTRHPEHPLLNTLVRDGYDAYARAALAERAEGGLPPFGYLALLEAEAPHAQTPFDFLEAATTLGQAQQPQQVAFWGPAPAPLERRAGRYRAHLLLHAPQRPALHRFLAQWTPRLAGLPEAGRVRWALEVDPQDLI